MTKQYIGSYTLQDFNDTTFFAEYSLTGLDGSWHTSFQSGDLFMRTKTGESSWSQAIRIVGEDGATGQSVVSVTPQYYLSTSTTSRVGGSWSNEMPTWASGKYLWTREEVKWANPTGTTFTTEILAKALNSANETAATAQTTATTAQTTANGKNTVYYQGSEPIGDTYKANDVWFDTANDNKMYRWSGTDWIATLFGVGAIGSTIIEDGLIATPLLSASNIQVGELDASVVTVSNLDAGKITTGELNASVVKIINLSAGSIYVGDTTTVQDKINEFDAFEVGGRNLLKTSGLTPAGLSSTKEFTLSGWASELANNTETLSMLTTGQEYTISFDMELVERTTPPTLFASQAGLFLYSASTANNVAFYTNKLVNLGDRYHYSERFICPELTDQRIIYYTNRYTTNNGAPYGFDKVKFTNVKLEKGNKPTDWTPAPEDIDAEFANIRTNIRTDENGDLLISRENSPTFMKLDPGNLSFVSTQNNLTLASFGTKEMEITNANVKQYLRIGSFQFVPGSDTNGDLTLKYIGEQE